MINFNLGVSLAPLDSIHMETIRAWRNDERIMKWCRQRDLITDLSQKRWFEKQDQDPSVKMYMIKNNTSFDSAKCDAGALVGVCGLTSIDPWNRHAEFSCYVAPEYQKLGLATEALRTLFRHGFEGLGLNLIWGETFNENLALDLFLKLGMKQEGVRRDFYFKGGKFIDAHLVSIKRDEFICSDS